MSRKTYIRPPNDDYAPDNNIQLGHVWRNPRDPGSLIGPALPIPEDIKVNHTYKGSWVMDTGRDSGGKVGFWAKIALLPVTADAGNSWSKGDDKKYTIPTLDTFSIEPTPNYIKSSVASVAAEILKSGYNLYMITGVKIARGGEGSNKLSKSVSINNELGVDGSVIAAPVEVGARLGLSRGSHDHQSFGSTSDYVFGYRVREIFYKKGVLNTKEFNKGAVLGEHIVLSGRGERGEAEIFIEEAELGDDDVEVEGELYSLEDDDGEECDFII